MLARALALLGRLARGLALLLLFVISAYFAFNTWVRRGVTAVPELAGLDEAAATERLTESGLVLRVAEAGRWSAEVEAGRVLESRPGAGSFVKRGAAIEAVLSLGVRRITLPDLTGKALVAARLTLENEGLAVGPVFNVITDRAGAGAVVAHDPAPGVELPPGAKVALLVALDASPQAWVMPDLVARRYEPARSALEAQGFRFGSVTFEPYEGIAAGTVLRQAPLPGHPLRRADSISLVVATENAGAFPVIEIAPSILAADLADLAGALAVAERGGADLVHVDVMDGEFVPNLTFGPPVVAALARRTTLPLDVHLMVAHPGRLLEACFDAGVARLAAHWEAEPHLDRWLQAVRARAVKAGVAINPATPVELLVDVLHLCDFVLVMSVNPGFAGQSFLPQSLDKCRRLASLIAARSLATTIELDGGVGLANAAAAVRAGVTTLVAGSSVYSAPDPAGAIAELRRAAEGGIG